MQAGVPLLEHSVVERIRSGNWSPGIYDALTQALTLDLGTEAQLCSQILRAMCTVDSSRAAPDPESFGLGVSHWIEHCAKAIENTDCTSSDGPSVHAMLCSRLSAAFVETAWALGVEWEADAVEDSDGRWRAEQLLHVEQSKLLLQMTKALIAAGVISHDLAKERLDPEFLEQLSAIPSAAAFTKKYIRLNTALNFKQTKFNLASEQSEGFSKLVTLIQATMAAIVPQQVSSGVLRFVSDNGSSVGCGDSVVIHALRSLTDLQQHVHCLLVDIKRLIGVFNLDPNRALDIIIDCFMSSVRFYWAFYIALLDASPWCQSQAESLKVAQLVGWKLQFYINGPASEHKYMDELATVAALLISHRLIQLSDLYSMLAPSANEAIDKEYDAWCATKREQHTGGTSSLLAKMGGLDDMGEEGEDKLSGETAIADGAGQWANQHALLCAKLLAIGDTESALVYLERFPNMARVHPSLADLAARVVDASTAELYRRTDCVRAPVKPRLRLKVGIALPHTEADLEASIDAWRLPSARHTSNVDSHTQPSVVLTPLVTKSNEEFFYDKFWLLDASRRMPTVRHVSDIPRVLAPWLNIAFLRLHLAPALLTRLIRFCCYGLAHSLGDESEWIGVLRAWILPSISFCESGAGLSNEVWLFISAIPLSKRYELYSDWDAILASGKPMLPLVLSDEARSSTAVGADVDVDVDIDPDHQFMAMSLDGALEGSESANGDFIGELCAASPAALPYVEIEMQHNEIRRKVRSVMRRLSGDTVKLMGRQLCNLCHPSPTLSMKVILDQVCSYDNLVDSVVEAFRYLTPLDADVLFYVILKILDDPNSTKVKDDSVNAAHWLQSLSLFIASYSYRHESPCLDVVLDYVLKRTVCAVRVEGAAPVPELTIVSDSILKLAAIDVMANATEEQTLALQGGHYLNSEAFSMVSPWVLSQDASIETVLTASTDNRLIKRMASWLTNLIVNRGQALSFAIALSVHAEKVVKMASLPLSNVLVIYDREIERVYQLFHLLHSNLKPEKYSKLIPGPHTLVSKYGLSWGLAILWGRPSIAMHLAQGLRKWEDDGERVFADITEQDVDETSMECVTTSEGQLPGRQGLDAAATQIEAMEPAAPIPSLGSPGSAAPANAEPSMDIDESEDANPQSKEESRANEQPQVVASLKFEAPLLPRAFVDHIARALPAQALSIGLSAEFVAVFWTLTPFDIEVPAGRYKKEIEIQSGLIKRVDALAKQSQSRSKAAQLAQIRSRATLAIDNLEKEMLEQRQHVSRIRRWLIAQKDYWFCMAHEQRKLITQALLQHCILPRAILSASDAGFCAKFLWMMHYPWATNKFSLMIVYDNVFSDSLSTLLAALTENEARSYAKFLNTSLAYLAPLHLQETQYRERAVNTWRGLTGFQQQSRYKRGYLPPQSRTIRQQTPSNLATGTGDELRIMPGSTMLSHDDFRTVMRKWQVNLTKAFISTLDSERNDTVRNGILALREMQKTFPVISQHGRRILDKVTEIAEGGRSTSGEGSGSGVADSNKNLKVMATSYGAYLGMAKKSWISESSYYPAPSKDVLPRSPQPSNLQASGKQATHATAEVVEVGGGGSTPRASRGDKESSHGKTNAENKPDKPQDERARTTATRRHVSAGAATVAAAAAVASVSATASTASPAMAQDASRPGTVAQKEKPTITSADVSKRPRGDNLPSADESGASRDQDSKRYRERGRGRQRERQHESDSLFPPRPADHGHRDSRSVRDSPLHADRDDLHTDAHQPKRGRDESAADGKLEPPRQRLATPTNVGAARGKSPVTPQVTSKSPSPSITSTAAKAPSEDVDRKRKELRAQLLKQQEEKQKQKQDIPQSAALPATPTEPREQNARGESAHQAGRERPTSDELKDGSGSGNRRDRRVPSRHQDSYERAGQQQHQQLGPNSGRDKGSKKQPPSQHLKSSDQGSNGRSDTPPQAQKASAHDRQQQPRVQTHLDSAAQGTHSGQSGRADRGSQRHGRGGGGSRNHSPPPRGERYAPAGETAAIRITGSRYNAKPESNRPANGDPPHRKGGPGDAHQPNENNDGGGNGQRRGPKRGRGIDGREWNDGKRYRK